MTIVLFSCIDIQCGKRENKAIEWISSLFIRFYMLKDLLCSIRLHHFILYDLDMISMSLTIKLV